MNRHPETALRYVFEACGIEHTIAQRTARQVMRTSRYWLPNERRRAVAGILAGTPFKVAFDAQPYPRALHVRYGVVTVAVLPLDEVRHAVA